MVVGGPDSAVRAAYATKGRLITQFSYHPKSRQAAMQVVWERQKGTGQAQDHSDSALPPSTGLGPREEVRRSKYTPSDTDRQEGTGLSDGERFSLEAACGAMEGGSDMDRGCHSPRPIGNNPEYI